MHYSKPNKRLSRDDWLLAGLQLLRKEGIARVTVDRLAAELGITRGSFYHHFKNRRDLLKDMLDYWIREWTLAVIDDVKALGLEPRTTLLALIKMIRHRSAADYDAAVRAWALNDPLPAKYVRQADKERLTYIKSLLGEAGFKGLDLENRARLLLYYEAFQPMMFAKPKAEDEDALTELRHRLLSGQ
ncbi:MAG: TetR/AcrR family transcriptional regulator [Filomicrobium sp.]